MNGALDESNGNLFNIRSEGFTPKQWHQVKHRELFLSRQIETLPQLTFEESAVLRYLMKLSR